MGLLQAQRNPQKCMHLLPPLKPGEQLLILVLRLSLVNPPQSLSRKIIFLARGIARGIFSTSTRAPLPCRTQRLRCLSPRTVACSPAPIPRATRLGRLLLSCFHTHLTSAP